MHFLFLFVFICSTTSNQLDFYPMQGYELNNSYFFAGDTLVVQEASGKVQGLFLKGKGAKYKSVRRISQSLIFRSLKPSYQNQLEPGAYMIISILQKKTFKKEAFALIENNGLHFIVALNSSIKNNEIYFETSDDRDKLYTENLLKSRTAFHFGLAVE